MQRDTQLNLGVDKLQALLRKTKLQLWHDMKELDDYRALLAEADARAAPRAVCDWRSVPDLAIARRGMCLVWG
jgi:hypothetical protein